jgi:hypothetical protein
MNPRVRRTAMPIETTINREKAEMLFVVIPETWLARMRRSGSAIEIKNPNIKLPNIKKNSLFEREITAPI